MADGLGSGGLEDVVFVESLLPALGIEVLKKKARDDAALAQFERTRSEASSVLEATSRSLRPLTPRPRCLPQQTHNPLDIHTVMAGLVVGQQKITKFIGALLLSGKIPTLKPLSSSTWFACRSDLPAILKQ